MNKKLLLTFGFVIFSGLIFSLFGANKVHAAVYCTWNGSTSGDWTDVNNWDIVAGCPGVPTVDHYNVVFPASATNKTITNVPDGLIIQSMDIQDTYSITGNTAHIVNGVTSVSNFTQINIDLTLDAAQTFESGYYSDINLNGFDLTLDSTNSPIVLNGVISGNGNIDVTATSSHTLVFNNDNTFVGSINVYDNGVSLTHSASLGDSANDLTMHSNAQGLFINNDVNIPNPITFYDNTFLDNISGDGELSGTVVIAGHGASFGAEAGTLTLSGTLLGTYDASFVRGIIYTGAGDLYLGTLSVLINANHINGTLGGPVKITSNGTLAGTGTIGGIIGDGGTVSPGNSPGILTVNGNVTLTSADTAQFEINGATVGTQYDQIQVSGTTDLGGSTLSVTMGYTPAGGTVFTLITSAGGLTGTFNGLPDGSLITLSGNDYIVNYTATDVTLSAVGGTVLTEISSFTSNPTHPNAGQPVTITVVVGTNFLMPTGTVELFDGVTSLGTATVSGGSAVFTLPTGFTNGIHSLTAVYSGDLVHATATSSVLSLSVGALSNTGVEVPVTLVTLLIAISAIATVYYYKKLKQLD